MKPLIHEPDLLDRISDAISVPDSSDSMFAGTLVASTAVDITVPTGAKIAVFSGSGPYYVKYASTAAIPGSFGAAVVEVNPAARIISDVTTISVISPDAIEFSVIFYSA